MMLLHDEGCKNPGKWTVMSRNTRRAGCAFEVVTHVMKGVEVKKGMCGKDFIASRMVPDEVRVAAKWGDKSVFEAMLATMFWAMEEYPNAKVFYFASGYCVPLQGPTVRSPSRRRGVGGWLYRRELFGMQQAGQRHGPGRDVTQLVVQGRLVKHVRWTKKGVAVALAYSS